MVSRIVANPVGSSARNNTPDQLAVLTSLGVPWTRKASGKMAMLAQSSPPAAKLSVVTGGHSRVMIDPQA